MAGTFVTSTRCVEAKAPLLPRVILEQHEYDLNLMTQTDSGRPRGRWGRPARAAQWSWGLALILFAFRLRFPPIAVLGIVLFLGRFEFLGVVVEVPGRGPSLAPPPCRPPWRIPVPTRGVSDRQRGNGAPLSRRTSRRYGYNLRPARLATVSAMPRATRPCAITAALIILIV